MLFFEKIGFETTEDPFAAGEDETPVIDETAAPVEGESAVSEEATTEVVTE